PGRAARSPRRGRALLAALVVLGLAGAIPVPSAITAPVQVVAAEPRHVFSAIDGIVGTLAVVPGQQVAAGDLLLRMDTRVLEKNVQEARQAMSVAQAELARNRAAAHYDADARAKLAVTQVELERARLELDFHLAQLERAELRSETAGQVLLEDPDRLPGAAVRMGERLLGIADTRRTRLRILVPLADFSLVDEGAPVRVTLDRSPLAGLSARVVRKGYTVSLSDEQVPSIVVEAEWETNAGEEGGAAVGTPDAAGGRAATPPAVPFGARGSA
ncbi:Multidrug resistance protein mdtA, partial [Thauera phenylacetica B4P]